MNKSKINNHDFLYPTPVFMVGAIVDGKPNFMPASWVMRVNVSPNIMAVSINPSRYTHAGIEEHQELSLNLMTEDTVVATDYCALVSGKNVDKSEIFEVFYGELEKAPMIQNCSICAACKVIETVSVPDHDVFIAEVIDTYVDNDCLVDDKPVLEKLKPFVFTMPGNDYWGMGKNLGKGWNIGKEYK